MSREKKQTEKNIIVTGARVNNLKNINVSIPKNKLVVVTGLSGSGKSSLAFDVIYAEGNRRYLEGMSSFARQFLEISAKPDVDKIENLSPTISIDQKSLSQNPRSTVGTITEMYDYLRVLFSKIGAPYCPNCFLPMNRKTTKEILTEILALSENTSIAILARIRKNQKSVEEILKSVSQLGYARSRINGKIYLIEDILSQKKEELNVENVEIVIDRLTLRKKNPDKERILDSLETAFKLGRGFINVCINNEEDKLFNQDFVCGNCYCKISEITLKHFSFNNSEGACNFCSGLGFVKELDEKLILPNKNLSLAEGAILPLSKTGWRHGKVSDFWEKLNKVAQKHGFSLDEPIKNISLENFKIILYGDENENSNDYFKGVMFFVKKKYAEMANSSIHSEIEKYMREKECPVCSGKRLKKEYLSVLISGKSIDDLVKMDMGKLIVFLNNLKKEEGKKIKGKMVESLANELILRAKALQNVGLGYLSLSRRSDSISGGEGQRIRLATQINSELSGVVYILDEPSVGLHSRDTRKLLETLEHLKNSGNSLLVVEHDKEIIKKADWIIDMGPGAGEEGGEVIFEGNIKKLKTTKTQTAKFLDGREKVWDKKEKRSEAKNYLEIIGASENNLKNIDVKIPLGRFVTITGVSGSGKSSFVNDILARALAHYFFRSQKKVGKYKKIKGLKFINKVISIDQSPIGRTPRSNAATYTGVFSLIREIFASVEEAKKRNYSPSRFSFNMKGGRCEDCQGDGNKKIEMYLMPDMYVKCETCQGSRYNRKTLDIEYQGVNIAEVLDMSVSYALRFFKNSPLIVAKLKTLEDVGLGYLKLGQSATSLSGGEAQRIKLATELSRKSMGKTFYILDEPTIGLHFGDVKKLLKILDALVEKGNTVLAVEHNLDFIQASDWVIDLGSEGGEAGGEIVYAGPTEKIKDCLKGWTGKYMRESF